VDLDPEGSALIWLSFIQICIGSTDPDPGAWKLTKIYNKKALFSTFQTIQLLVTAKSMQGPVLDPYLFGSLEPDPD
jgi:hypothetical protein